MYKRYCNVCGFAPVAGDRCVRCGSTTIIEMSAPGVKPPSEPAPPSSLAPLRHGPEKGPGHILGEELGGAIGKTAGSETVGRAIGALVGALFLDPAIEARKAKSRALEPVPPVVPKKSSVVAPKRRRRKA
jgi:hypothetical protein